MKWIFTLWTCWHLVSLAQAQSSAQPPSIPVRIGGRIVDSVSGQGLAGVHVVVLSLRDSSRRWGASSDLQGTFDLRLPRQGGYLLRCTYVGYEGLQRVFRWTSDTDLGTLRLIPVMTSLGEVEIQGTARRVEQRGDTTEISASSFRTAPDADAEQLIRKMPGITVENGQLKAQGEEVRRVLLDGQEYFGNDATAALRNLPAEVIDKVQLIDRQSDQAQFTGINDGNTEKTLNLITRTGLNNSRFGKLYAGLGDFTGSATSRDDKAFEKLVLPESTSGSLAPTAGFLEPTRGVRWMGGGQASYFKGRRRLSAALLLNNINQQNFSGAELSGLLGGGGNLGGTAMGGMRGGGGRGGGMPDPGAALLNPSQRGLTTTLSSALNYSDQWSGGWKLNSSLLVTRSVNAQNAASLRSWLSIPGLTQSDSSRQIQDNLQNRWTARLEWNPDSNRSMIWTPRFTVAQRTGLWASAVSVDSTWATGSTLERSTRKLSQNLLSNTNENHQTQGGFEALYRQRLAKPRRNFSVNWALDFQDQSTPRDQVSEIFEAGQGPFMPPGWWSRRDTTRQAFDQERGFLRNRWDLNYLEPWGKRGLLEWTVSPLVQQSLAEQRSSPVDTGPRYGLYNQALQQNLSGAQYGLRYRWGDERQEFSMGLQRQDYIASLEEVADFRVNLPREVGWRAWLPNASWRYNPTKFQQYRIFYRSSTQTPSVQQMQPVLDNTNPLSLSVGNPDLEQALTHNLGGRFRWSDGPGGRSVFVFINGNLTQDAIGNENLVVPADTNLMNQRWLTWKGLQQLGVDWRVLGLARGAQLTRPTNLGNQINGRWYSTYAHPFAAFQANMNWTLTLGYLDQPVRNNGLDSRVKTQNLGLLWGLSSSRSERWDYNISLNLGFNRFRNSTTADRGHWLNYATHSANARIQYTWRQRWVLGSDYAWTYWGGLDQGFNANIHLMNLSLATKVLPNKLGEWRISVFDLLGQNRSVSRSVSELFVDDNRNTALGRFLMLTFTYNFRNFGQPSRMQPVQNGAPMGHPEMIRPIEGWR
ncbi:MAG: outer membrane beta-barrel protein [Bacteroidota bacterium]